MGGKQMTAWFTSPATTPRATCPNEIFVRFVANNYFTALDRARIFFLDIGCGSGANAEYLKANGFLVSTVDSAPEAKPDFCMGINEYFENIHPAVFDCIFDINTLCHVENPPYEAIYKALKPGGKFFSIHPASSTEANFDGKGFTRKATMTEMHDLLERAFSKFTVRHSNYPGREGNITSWVIEATR